MKELLEKINNLQQEIETDSNHLNTSIFKDVKPNEVLVRNSPKVRDSRLLIPGNELNDSDEISES